MLLLVKRSVINMDGDRIREEMVFRSLSHSYVERAVHGIDSESSFPLSYLKQVADKN